MYLVRWLRVLIGVPVWRQVAVIPSRRGGRNHLHIHVTRPTPTLVELVKLAMSINRDEMLALPPGWRLDWSHSPASEVTTMTADDARKLTAEVTTPDPHLVRVVLDLWYTAIRKAAARGKDSVRESECDRVRMPVPTSAKVAALEQLRRDGFTARHEATGHNETEMTISWGPKPIPPRGGTGTPPRLRT